MNKLIPKTQQTAALFEFTLSKAGKAYHKNAYKNELPVIVVLAESSSRCNIFSLFCRNCCYW